ncbi:MAG: FIST C-terminal domain-containing protein [Firmicutes bacterium]|nr:FIST C-terminal domain-containing protein [Bacillota bacterium]
MNILNAYSQKTDVQEAVDELKEKFSGFSGKFLLYFASSKYDHELLSVKMAEAFPGVENIGCTSCGEIISGMPLLDNSVVAMLFNEKAIADVNIRIIQNIDNENCDLEEKFKGFEEYFKIPMTEMEIDKYVGIILIDGLRLSEEKLMENICNRTNVVMIGGSAGDDLQFKETRVFANGISYTNAAVIALLKPGMKFGFLKTQSFSETGKSLTATKVNEATREVLEFDGKPAVGEYLKAVGLEREEAEKLFMKHPIGLMFEGEPFVRSLRIFNGDNIAFFCNIIEGMELSVLEWGNIIAKTKQDLQAHAEENGKIEAMLMFNCILRTLEIKSKNLVDEYAEIYKNIPTIGFSTYGEAFLGHINQTATILTFHE